MKCILKYIYIYINKSTNRKYLSIFLAILIDKIIAILNKNELNFTKLALIINRILLIKGRVCLIFYGLYHT